MREIAEQFKKLGMSPEAVDYDEEFKMDNSSPHMVRLTIIEALNRVVIADHIIPRENFNTKLYQNVFKHIP